MRHSHNTTHTVGSSSFLYIVSSCRDRNPGVMGGVYSKFFPRTHTIPAKHFTSKLDQQDAFAPFGPFKLMQATRPKVMAIRAGAIVSDYLITPQSPVTKTITEQTPYPELHSSRPGRESVANMKCKFQISTRVRPSQPHGFSTI
jgi:hypothetical protein